jgi:hypothetical protein
MQWERSLLGRSSSNAGDKKMKMVLSRALAVISLALMLLPAQAAEEMAAETIAVQIRSQGYACDKAQSAERDKEFSKPGEAAWILTCSNATYRVRLVPDMAAKVEKLD